MTGQGHSYEVSRILVGVAGGSAAGKTTLCEGIRQEMQFDTDFDMCIITLDSFYKGIDTKTTYIPDYNFDHPDALDFDLAYQVLKKLLAGQVTEVPIYDFKTHSRLEQTQLVVPSQVIFFEGILALYDERIRNMMNYKIFIHCDGTNFYVKAVDDIRLCRRILRDVKERGREVSGILYQYNRFVKRAFDEFIRPTMSYSDIIVPGMPIRSDHNRFPAKSRVNQLDCPPLEEPYKATRNSAQENDELILLWGPLISFGSTNTAKPERIGMLCNYISKILVKEHTPERTLIFPIDEQMKQDLNNQLQTLGQNNISTAKQYYKLIKHLLKQCLLMLEKSFKLRNLKLDLIEPINLQDIYDLHEQKINENGIKNSQPSKHPLIILPYFFVSNGQLLQNLSDCYQQHHPKVRLIIITLFSDLKTITAQKPHSVLIIVNAFLIGRLDKFINYLKRMKNEQKQEQQVRIDDVLFESTRLCKKSERFIRKRIEKP